MEIKKTIRKLIPEKLKNFISYSEEQEYQRISYSQYGEDLIIENLINGFDTGFYIDVGAYHPIRFSNTYLLYIKGWRGINIEPRPGSKILFDQFRPDDINIELGISQHGGKLSYYNFHEGLQNTFKKGFIKKADPQLNPSKSTLLVQTKLLSDIVAEYQHLISEFNLLCVDAEGADLEVLKSNDWNVFKPDIIVVEDHDFLFDGIKSGGIQEFLTNLGYTVVCRGINSSFYRLR